MTTISDLTAIGLGAPQVQVTAETSQDTFLTLMLTQLQNQDPMQPLESGEFLSQLAAFETAAGVGNLESSLAALNASLYTSQALQASSLLGHEVLTTSSTATLAGSGSITGVVQLAQSTGSVQLEVLDASGAVVRHIDLGSQPAGKVPFEWDGLDDEGARLPPGQYQIKATVSGADGTTQAGAVALSAEVQSVSLDGGDILLNLADGSQIPFSQVTEIL